MNAAFYPQGTVPASAPASIDGAPNDTPPAPRRTPDALDKAPLGPLARPMLRLWEGLDSLFLAGHLRDVELDLTHLDCPCFLLDIAPERPKFYVEMFLDSLDDPEGRGETLLVLMNWMGSDTEPSAWETGLVGANAGGQEKALDFSEVLGHVLRATRIPTRS